MITLRSTSTLSKKRPRVYLQHLLPLQESAVMMLYAYGGVGKSFLAIRLAYEFAMENPTKKVALWLTEDSEAENRRRCDLICQMMGWNTEDFDDRVHFIPDEPIKFTKMNGGNAVVTQDFYQIRLDLVDYDFVIIDPLLQFQGCDENSNTHAGVLMGALKTWAKEEMKVVLLLHHATPVQSDKRGLPILKARGAGDWVNSTRGAYQLNRRLPDDVLTEEDARTLRATLTKDNGLAYYVRKGSGDNFRDILVFPEEWEITKDKTPTVPFISVATHNSAHRPDGFERRDIYFKDLHNFVIGDCAYSQYAFKDDYRLGDNNLGGVTIICLDIDEGMTIETAKKTFGRYECLIVTTRSHQKEKGSKAACDRFRVFLNLRSPLEIPLDEYSKFFDHLYNKIGSVDGSTKDLARFFFASPLDAYYWYSSSSTKYDWIPPYEEMKKIRAKESIKRMMDQEKRTKQQNTQKGHGGEPNNTLPEDTMFETKQGFFSFSQFRDVLSIGEKIMCKCVDKHDHGGEFGYSAFVKKGDNGNVFYSCSGGRCSHLGSLWCAGWKS